MSWTATTGYSPTLKKPLSVGSIVGNGGGASGANGAAYTGASGGFAAGGGWENGATASAADQEVVVPLVLWNEPPRVEISCLHVLHLPMSQPSQNSSTTSHASFVRRNSGNNANKSSANLPSSSAASSMRKQNSSDNSSNKVDKFGPAEFAGLQIQIVDDEDGDGDETQYQVCVFAGTVDGVVIYWLFEQETVVQVNMLLFSGDEAPDATSEAARKRGFTSQPVQGIVSGTDEWGQSMLISITRDGSVARWQLPNGMCSCASASLAKQLAPVKGMEMFCNSRYAMVYSEETRMMVLDTWKMTLLYCMDTAQEQIRRSIAVGELKMPVLKTWTNFSKNPLGANAGSARTAVDGQGESSSSASRPTNGVHGSSFTNSSSSTSLNGQVAQASASKSFSNASGVGQLANTVQLWDSLVISLGAEGLVKCFLWSKPRGGSSAPSSSFGAFQWVQESCWVISWADEADDITCSQSTSLKDGDHMNPQTALMRSIKSSYFPLSVRISPDSSLILFIWKTKWVVLKRKWLCKVDNSSGSGIELRARWQYWEAAPG
ncbi:hypothetical protein Gpo141_00004144 [Globisporangium polare]